MTKEQYEHWKDFALRMAGKYPRTTEARRERLTKEVSGYFDYFDFGGQDVRDGVEDWDYNDCGYHPGSEVEEHFDDYRHWNEKIGWYDESKFFTQIVCCIRAAFDIAVKQSGGVVGFTAGDMRRMWDGNVPEWAKGGWEVPFDSIQDDEHVWM